jgi:hypothetical protein
MAALLKLVQKEKSSRGREELSRATPGRPRRSVAGSYIDDLAALRKAVLLTPDEAKKFNAESVGYGTPRGSDDFCFVTGYSDASGERCNRNGILFLPKEN